LNRKKITHITFLLLFLIVFTHGAAHPSDITLVIDYPSISPNGDGIKDESPVYITLETNFDSLVVTIKDDTQVLDTLLLEVNPGVGSYIVQWEGKDSSELLLSDSEYLLELYATRPDTTIIMQTTVIVDTSPPSIHIDRIEPGVFSPDNTDTTNKALIYYTVTGFNDGSKISATITDPEDNVEDIILNIFSDTSCCLKWSPDNPISGIYTVSMLIEDLAGNIGTGEGYINVDADPPEILFITSIAEHTKQPPDSISGTIYDRSTIDSLSFIWNDTLTIIPDEIYTLNDTTYWNIVILDSVSSSGIYIDGNYSLGVYASDRFGQSADNTISFKIDTTTPDPPVLAQPASPVLISEVELSYAADLDLHADFVVFFRLHEGDTSADTVASFTSHPIIDLEEGKNEIWAKVTDKAGNESDESNHILVTYDTSSQNSFPEAFREPDDFIISTSRAAGKVIIQLFDLRGEKVRSISSIGPATYFKINWDLLNNDGEEVRNGAYLAVITVYYSDTKTVDKGFVAVVR